MAGVFRYYGSPVEQYTFASEKQTRAYLACVGGLLGSQNVVETAAKLHGLGLETQWPFVDRRKPPTTLSPASDAFLKALVPLIPSRYEPVRQHLAQCLGQVDNNPFTHLFVREPNQWQRIAESEPLLQDFLQGA